MAGRSGEPSRTGARPRSGAPALPPRATVSGPARLAGPTRTHPMLDLACPLPALSYDHVLLGHGSGGRLSAELLAKLFLPALGNDVLSALEDQATLPLPGEAGARLALTTDSFVVRPLFFPG